MTYSQLREEKPAQRQFLANYSVTYSEYKSVHFWLRKKYGKATFCEAENCAGKSKVFQWAKLPEVSYEKKRENFIRLCSKCHANMDNSPASSERKSLAHRTKKSPAPPVPVTRRGNGRRAIVSFLEGTQVATFPSLSEAARVVDRSVWAIGLALKNNTRSAGFHWYYLPIRSKE